MSILEKAITLMETMPEHKIETIYAFIRFMDSEPKETDTDWQKEKKAAVQSMIGIAHKYANPALNRQEEGAFERAMAEKHASNRY